MSFQITYGLCGLKCHIVGKGQVGCDCSGFGGSGGWARRRHFLSSETSRCPDG